MEKHGPQLPLGTDLFEAREIVTAAARKEYAIVVLFEGSPDPEYDKQIRSRNDRFQQLLHSVVI